MAEILASKIKLYQCTTWTEGNTHGGVINTSAEIPSSGENTIFDDVSDSERIAGDTEYRKVFVRNENADTINLKGWIEKQYSASNESISICLGTDSGIQTTAGEGLNGTYITPLNIDSGIDFGSLALNSSKAIWIKRTVTAGGEGYKDDSFQIKVGMY